MPLPSTRRLRAAFVLSTLLLLASATNTLVAQSVQTGTLDGRVTLADGRAIANATVEVRQADGSYPRTTRTDGTGYFTLPFLLPGRYDVTVRQLGFREARIVAVTVRVAERTQLRVTLDRARDTLPAVVVTEAAQAGTAPLSSAVTFVLSARERERLPAPRDVNALVRFIPGVRPGQIFGGSTNQANLYQLDGVMVNQPGLGGSFLLPNVDWLEDVRVIGLGAGAEYGHFQGGLINLVTKSGSNTLQGALRTFAEQRALNGTAAGDVDVRTELEDRYEVSGDLRGPIVRDRLYFFVSGQEVRVRERVPASFTDGGWLAPYTERRERKYYGKLTWQATGNDLVHLSLGLDDLARERVGLSPFVAAEATTRGESPSLFFQGNWQRVQSANRQLDVRVSGYAGRDDELPYNGDRPSVALLDDPDVPRFVNASYTRRNTPRSLGLNLVQSLRLPAGPATHLVKVGAEATIGSWRETRSRNGGLSWYTEAGANFDPFDANTWQTIPSLGIYATADTGASIDLNAGTFNGAVFLQDELQVGARLSLSLGLRLNAFSGTITPGHDGRSGDARGEAGSGRTFTAVRAGGVDPRFGVTYDVAGDRRTLLKGHWGRYHQNLFALMFDRAPGANVYTDLDYCDWNDQTGAARPDPGQRYRPSEFATQFTCFPGATLALEAERIRPYRQPFVDQLMLGVERALGPALRAELLYVRRANRNVLTLVDDRRDRNWSPLADVSVSDAIGPVRDLDGNRIVLPRLWVRNDDLVERLRAGDVVPGYVPSDTLRLWYEPEFALQANDEARRHFDQVQLVLSGRWARADVTAALAWTRLTGNFFAVSGYLDPSGNGNGPWVDPNTGINAQGRLDGFSPWDFKLRASGVLPKGFEGGAFLSIQAGDAWTPALPIRRTLDYAIDTGIGVVPLDDALVRFATGQSILLEPRGARQLDLLATLDLRVQRALAVAGRSVVFGLEVFNALGGNAVTARSTSVLDDAGAVRARQAPRTIRVSAQLR